MREYDPISGMPIDEDIGIVEILEMTSPVNPEIEPSLFGKSFALVGSSSIVLNGNHGEYIDSHDVVVRFNESPTESYEKHVGTKTSIRISNTHFIKALADEEFSARILKDWSGWDPTFYYKIRNEKLVIKKHSAIKYINNAEEDERILRKVMANGNSLHFVTPQFFHLGDALVGGKELSLGFMGILMAMKYGSKISCFGFNFYREEESKRHYYEEMKQSPEDQKKSHNFDKEEDLFKLLSETNLIKAYR